MASFLPSEYVITEVFNDHRLEFSEIYSQAAVTPPTKGYGRY